MVGGTTPPQSDSGEISRVGPQPSLAKQAVLTHRPGYFCLDNAFALIEGIPKANPLLPPPTRSTSPHQHPTSSKWKKLSSPQTLRARAAGKCARPASGLLAS